MSKPIDINEVIAELEEDRKNGTLAEKVLGKRDCMHCADMGVHLCPDVAEPILIPCCKKGCKSRKAVD